VLVLRTSGCNDNRSVVCTNHEMNILQRQVIEFFFGADIMNLEGPTFSRCDPTRGDLEDVYKDMID
jgi:hypothetical protein